MSLPPLTYPFSMSRWTINASVPLHKPASFVPVWSHATQFVWPAVVQGNWHGCPLQRTVPSGPASTGAAASGKAASE